MRRQRDRAHSFLCRAGAALLWALASGACARDAEPAAVGQPNILLIVTDDQRADDMIAMPETRRRFRAGVTFSNAYVTTSLCCPSRISILTGLYAHNHGVLTNTYPRGGYERAVELGADTSTVAKWLSDSGYTTALIGKYLNGYDGWRAIFDPLEGWSEQIMPDFAYSVRWVVKNRIPRRIRAGYTTDVVSDQTLDFITRQDGPWFALVAFQAPHLPHVPAARHAGRFADHPAPVAAQADMYRQRLETLLAVDEGVARMVDSLSALGVLNNTLIIFTSDNGFLVGERGLIGKNVPYEESVRVPLLVMGPGVEPGVRTELVANIDLAPTIADFAGVDPPRSVDGRSLRPLLSGATPRWRDALLTEHWIGRDPVRRVVGTVWAGAIDALASCAGDSCWEAGLAPAAVEP